MGPGNNLDGFGIFLFPFFTFLIFLSSTVTYRNTDIFEFYDILIIESHNGLGWEEP